MIVLHTDRGIHRTQEKLQIRRAVNLDQGPELVYLQSSLVLVLMVELVGHVGIVVPNTLTHRYCDRLALPPRLLGQGEARGRNPENCN